MNLDKRAALEAACARLKGKVVLATVRTALEQQRISVLLEDIALGDGRATITLRPRQPMLLDPGALIDIEYNSLRFTIPNPARVVHLVQRGQAVVFRLPFAL